MTGRVGRKQCFKYIDEKKTNLIGLMKIINLLYIFSASLLLYCTNTKTNYPTKHWDVIEGDYLVFHHEDTVLQPTLEVKVNNKRTNKAIENAVIFMPDIDVGGFTDSTGEFSKEVPEGYHQVEISYGGSKGGGQLKIDSVLFKHKTITEILVNLGSVIEH